MDTTPDLTYETWLHELKLLAEERELAWLISSAPENHRKGYDKGFSPEEELNALADLAEWRGCGCGGS